MKLIFCQKCHDIIALRYVSRTCACGVSSGRYLDETDAIIQGPCTPLGLDNQSFVQALQLNTHAAEHDLHIMRGVTYNAFVIPENVASITRITDDD